MMDGPKNDWIERVYRRALQVFGEGDTAMNIKAMEKVYLERLRPTSSHDTEFARAASGESQKPFWRDARLSACFRAAYEGA